ncbi:hypothetical protein KI387_041654, partial [Taxus chinensis]
FAGSVEALGVDKLIARLDTTFAMVSCLSTNTVLGVGWYVDSGASRHMTLNKAAFFRLKEQHTSMQVELGDDAKYSVTGIGSISFRMPVGEVLELHEV